MKRKHFFILIVLSLLFIVSCTKNTKGFPDGFFDDSPNTQTSEGTKGQNTEKTPEQATVSNSPFGTNSDTQNSGEKNENAENDDNKQEDTNENSEENKPPVNPEPVSFSHSDSEKSSILARYSEAESFYYDILCQNFELDNMDVITAKSDGYEMTYNRVIFEDVNSLSELRALYSRYFTASFIGKLDFSAYRESDGKLYCAATSGSHSGKSSKYTATVESVDEDNAVVIRKDSQSGGIQRISAVKSGENWYFVSVAMR